MRAIFADRRQDGDRRIQRRQGLRMASLPLVYAADPDERGGFAAPILLRAEGGQRPLIVGQRFLEVVLHFMQVADLEQLVAVERPRRSEERRVGKECER